VNITVLLSLLISCALRVKMCDYFYTSVIVSLITKLGQKKNTAKYLDLQGHTS